MAAPPSLARMVARAQAVSIPAIAFPAPSRSFSSASSRIISARPQPIARNPRPFLRIRRPGLLHPANPFSSSATRRHGHIETPKPGEELWVTFVEKDGREHKVAVSAGDNLLDIAQAHDLEMEGACGGSCACSTCHVIVQEEYYDKIPEPDDDENDMLDLAFGLTETSRLGCQIVMTPELDGLKVKLPSMTRNLQASDFK